MKPKVKLWTLRNWLRWKTFEISYETQRGLQSCLPEGQADTITCCSKALKGKHAEGVRRPGWKSTTSQSPEA